MSTTEMNYSNRWFLGLFLLGATILGISLTRGVVELLSVQDRIDEAEERVEELASERERLERERVWRSSRVFQDAEIREHLHMALPGEVVLVLPSYLEELMYVPIDVSENEMQMRRVEKIWWRWWKVFVHPE